MLSSTGGSWSPELIHLSSAFHWPIPLSKGLLSQVRVSLWHPQHELWSLHLWPLDRGHCNSPVKVANINAKARAPSTRRLYALKWYGVQSETKTHPLVRYRPFSFYKSCWLNDTPSTLKVYVAAIAMKHPHGQPICRKKRLRPGLCPVEFPLGIFVRQPAGHRHLPLLGFITWMSLLFRHGSCPLNCLVPIFSSGQWPKPH